MTIFSEALSQIKVKDNTQKMRELCDKIQKEEMSNIVHSEGMPTGPNVFLTLEVPGRYENEIAFLTLEREYHDSYLAVLFTMPISKYEDPDVAFKRQKTWQISESKPEKILTSYAKTYKYLRGE